MLLCDLGEGPIGREQNMSIPKHYSPCSWPWRLKQMSHRNDAFRVAVNGSHVDGKVLNYPKP